MGIGDLGLVIEKYPPSIWAIKIKCPQRRKKDIYKYIANQIGHYSKFFISNLLKISKNDIFTIFTKIKDFIGHY